MQTVPFAGTGAPSPCRYPSPCPRPSSCRGSEGPQARLRVPGEPCSAPLPVPTHPQVASLTSPARCAGTAALGSTMASMPVMAARASSRGASAGTGPTSASRETRYRYPPGCRDQDRHLPCPGIPPHHLGPGASRAGAAPCWASMGSPHPGNTGSSWHCSPDLRSNVSLQDMDGLGTARWLEGPRTG